MESFELDFINKNKKRKEEKILLKTLNYNKPLDIFKQIGLAQPTLDYHYLFSYQIRTDNFRFSTYNDFVEYNK